MTASLPEFHDTPSADTEGVAASGEPASAPAPKKPRTPRGANPRRPAPKPRGAAPAASADDAPENEAAKTTPAARAPRAPRTTAARSTSGARTPSTARSGAQKPSTSRASTTPQAAGPRAILDEATGASEESQRPTEADTPESAPVVPHEAAAGGGDAPGLSSGAGEPDLGTSSALDDQSSSASPDESRPSPRDEVSTTPGIIAAGPTLAFLSLDAIVIPPRPPLPVPMRDHAPETAAPPAGGGPTDPAPADISAEASPTSADVANRQHPSPSPAEGEEKADPTTADVTVEGPLTPSSSEGDFVPTSADVDADDPASSSSEGVADPTPADVAAEEPPTLRPMADAADPTPADVAVDEPPTASPSDRAHPGEEEREDRAGVGVDEIDAAPAPDDESVGEPDLAAVVGRSLDDAEVIRDDSDSEGGVAEDPTPPAVRVDEIVATEVSERAPTTLVLPAEGGETTADDEDDDKIAAALPPIVVDEPASDAARTAEDDPEAAAPALSLRHITKTFGELRAVDAVDLTVPAGSFYGLVGPNGAGKTTTLSIIAGLLRADSGSVNINGVDARKNARQAKKLIGVLPDRLRTFDRLTGRQLLSYYGALRGLPGAVVESRTADLARAFDLVDALARPVSDYSAGMTKKVMLAGAMIHSPRLLVLDEPFESVDPVSSGVILGILSAYVEHGGTVILSSHGMELVERVCSRVAVIVGGQVLAEGTVDEVRGDGTLEQRFRELSGGLGDVEGLEWLHTFSA